jgi:hypothetical protein
MGSLNVRKDWVYKAESIGYPGRVRQGKVVAEPHNLAAGWVGFDFAAAFERPVKLLNDAALQDYVGLRGFEQRGQAEWEKHVEQVVARLKTLPPGCRAGSNDNAFLGGFSLW